MFVTSVFLLYLYTLFKGKKNTLDWRGTIYVNFIALDFQPNKIK